MSDRAPDFLCIGAQRCGTTTLHSLLGQDPRVFLPEQKELHLFDERDGPWRQRWPNYLDHFASASPDQVVGEITPEYMVLASIRDRIAEVLPNVRLIAILRDPVKRAWSQYWFNIRRGYEHLSFDAALDTEAGLPPEDERGLLRRSYITRGRYAQQLRRFEAVFGRDRLHVLFLDELLKDPVGTMAGLQQFLGLSPSDAPGWQMPQHNRGVYMRSRGVNNAANWLRGVRARRRHRRPWPIRKIGGAVRRLNMAAGTPPLPPATAERLARAFAGPDRELRDWLGRPLPWASAEPLAPTPDLFSTAVPARPAY